MTPVDMKNPEGLEQRGKLPVDYCIPPQSRLSRLYGVAVSLLVFALGVAALIPTLGLPLWQIASARNWPAVPCEIVSSRVHYEGGALTGGESVEVSFRYQTAGRSYTAARYKFVTGASHGFVDHAAIVARLPAGTKTVCFVNPDDPLDAVIERGLTTDLLFGLMMPLPITLLGAYMLVWCFRKRE